MATFYSSQYANIVAVPSAKIDSPDAGGDVKIAYFEYVATASIPATSDVIKLCILPKGARVLDVEISSPDMGTTGAINVGWAASSELGSTGSAVEAANATGFMAALDINTAAVVANMSDVSGAAAAGYLKKFSATVDVQIAPSTIWTATSGTIKGFIKYATV